MSLAVLREVQRTCCTSCPLCPFPHLQLILSGAVSHFVREGSRLFQVCDKMQGVGGAFPNVQDLKCCYHVSLEFQIKIWAWCSESHCVQVLYNNIKWGLCFLMLFITNTWIHLNSPREGDGTVGFLALLWVLLVHFFPEKLIWLGGSAGLGGWRFKNF